MPKRKRKPKVAAPDVIICTPAPDLWKAAFDAFKEQHGDWCTQYIKDDPIYALPGPIIDALTKSSTAKGRSRASSSLLSKVEEAAERELLAVCQNFNNASVGVWCGSPVIFPLLASIPSATAWLNNAIVEYEQEKARRAGTQPSPQDLAKARNAGQDAAIKVGEYSHQLAGYVGWLMDCKVFRDERDALKAAWVSADRPRVFPLAAGELQQNRKKSGKAPPGFLPQVLDFLRKWQLARMVTWDLPEPQGPVMVPAGAVPPVVVGGVSIVLPTYFDISTSNAFHHEVVEQQYQLAKALGLPSDHPLKNISPTRAGGRASAVGGSPFLPSQWETAFRLWFIEQAVRSRYDGRRGLVVRLIAGMQPWLRALGQAVNAKRIEQVRRLYRPSV